MKYLSILFLLVGLSFVTKAQTFEVSIDKSEIKIGEQAELELQVGFPAAKKNIMLPVLKDTISKFVEIIEISEIDTTFDQDDITQKFFTQKVTVTSWDSGIHVIQPFKAIVDGDTLTSEPLLLTVSTIPIEAEKDLKDIKGIIEVPFSLWDWILSNKTIILSILAAIILFIIGFVLWKKYKNKPVEEKIEYVPKEAADIVALKKLDQLKAEKLWQSGKVKAFHTQLSFITREYIENRFEFNALEQTTEEIQTMLAGSSVVTKEELTKLYHLLQMADLAKFAKQQPLASENEMALNSAYQFVDKTKVVTSEDDETNLTEKKDA